MKPSRQPYVREAEYTPLNSRREDILREAYHLKLLLVPARPRGFNIVLGKDEGAWCAYHWLRGHHTEDCYHLKREIEILIQRGRLLSYVKDVGGQAGKRSHPRGEASLENPPQKMSKSTYEVRKTRVTCHTLNTISGGFTGEGETSYSRKRYARAMMHKSQKPFSEEEEENSAVISFSNKDAEGVLAHENDPMVIKVQIHDWSMKRVLVDPRSSADVMYWDAFKGMNFDIAEMLPFKGTLIGFSGEQVQVLGNLPIMTNFGNRDNAKSVKVVYLIVNVASPYNIIIGKLSFNALEATLSTLYLTLEYPLEDGRVRVVKGDHGLTRKCYNDSLKLKNKGQAGEPVKDDHLKVNLVDIDLREDLTDGSPKPTEEVKKVHYLN